MSAVLELLEALDPPRAFVVRLLNPDHEDFTDVEAFFATVVQPIVEGELGYKLTVVDGSPLRHLPFAYGGGDLRFGTARHPRRVPPTFALGPRRGAPCGPSSGQRYAIESQFTRAARDLANRFEHRLFLSATPHNGHSNSFSTLLELLDPQRFTRGVPIRPRELEPVMVRCLKSDLRHFGERFPERVVESIPLSGLPADAPELVLAHMLAVYSRSRP